MATTPPRPMMDHLDALHRALEDARQAFIDTCDRLTVQEFLTPRTDFTQAIVLWQEAARAWNTATLQASNAIRDFIDAHEDPWIASSQGQAYAAWADAFEWARVETTPYEPLYLSVALNVTHGTLDGSVENVQNVLPDTPALPVLDL